jgi:serpin B
MKIILSIFLTFIISVSVVPFGFSQPAADIFQANNHFAFDLYSHLDPNKGNIFFSPYSLSSALTMVYEGARNQTADEMRTVLHLPSDEVDWRTDLSNFIQSMNTAHQAYELSTANALWAQKAYPFKEGYLKLIKDTYFAEARNLDFVSDPEASRVTINSWVSKNTKDRINDLLPPRSITPETRLILTNAVYFKGKWETPFDKGDTKSDTFWLDPSQSVQTDMMTLEGKSFDYMDNDQAQVLLLPYQGDDLSMLIVLPRSKDIQGLEKILNQDILKQWQGGMTSQEVNVSIPKFKFDSGYEMSGILSGMGMNLAFDPNNADFSGMADKVHDENLYIGGVFHKAWIETNEEGTEAAAATAVGMMAGAMYHPQERKVFRADHPFIFVIQESKTGHILFMGRVSDPREKQDSRSN